MYTALTHTYIHSKMKSLEQTISKKDVSRRLRHENSEKVWNELSLYKSMCEDLRKQVYVYTKQKPKAPKQYIYCIQALS